MQTFPQVTLLLGFVGPLLRSDALAGVGMALANTLLDRRMALTGLTCEFDVLWYPDVALLAVELVAATAGIRRGATDCRSFWTLTAPRNHARGANVGTYWAHYSLFPLART